MISYDTLFISSCILFKKQKSCNTESKRCCQIVHVVFDYCCSPVNLFQCDKFGQKDDDKNGKQDEADGKEIKGLLVEDVCEVRKSFVHLIEEGH